MTLVDQPHVTIDAPTDPALRTLWNLAVAKARAQGREPQTRADWRGIIDEYGRLLAKRRGPLGRIIREVCAEAPGGD